MRDLPQDRHPGTEAWRRVARHLLAALLPDLAPPRSRLGEWRFRIGALRGRYLAVHGRLPALLRPRRFSEKMQWRKLFDLDPRFAILSDKLAARDYVADRVGPGRQAALLWSGDNPAAIPFASLAPPYVLKSSHASAHVLLVHDRASLDEAAARARAAGWLAHRFGDQLHEPGYIPVPPRLLVEAMLLAADGAQPTEYRIFCFDGEPHVIQMTTATRSGPAGIVGFFTPDWAVVPIVLATTERPPPPPRPARMDAALDLARRLSAGFSHARVDLFDAADGLFVGEITLYAWSGLGRFRDDAQDLALGAAWRLRWPMLRALWAIAFRRWAIPAAAERPRQRGPEAGAS